MHRSEGDSTRRDTLALTRTALANERTLLAYMRTALALLATGILLLKFFEAGLLMMAAWIGIVVGFAVLAVGFNRYRRVKRIMNEV